MENKEHMWIVLLLRAERTLLPSWAIVRNTAHPLRTMRGSHFAKDVPSAPLSQLSSLALVSPAFHMIIHFTSTSDL